MAPATAPRSPCASWDFRHCGTAAETNNSFTQYIQDIISGPRLGDASIWSVSVHAVDIEPRLARYSSASAPIMAGIWSSPPPPPQSLLAGPLKTHLLVYACTPILWLLFSLFVSEDFHTFIWALVGVRAVRWFGRCANLCAPLHNRFTGRTRHGDGGRNLFSLQMKKRKATTMQRELRYETLTLPKASRGLRSCVPRRVFTLNNELLEEPLLLPLDVERSGAKTSLFSTAADTLRVNPRHVIKNEVISSQRLGGVEKSSDVFDD